MARFAKTQAYFGHWRRTRAAPVGLLVALGAAGLATVSACKVEERTRAAADSTPAVDLEPSPPPEVEPAVLLTGYTAAGPVQCLPLPTGRQCLPRRLPLTVACEAAKGEIQLCEDCQPICSKVLVSPVVK